MAPHEWEIVGAFCVGKDQVDTEVLHRCKICGAVKIVELKGDWAMDQLVESKSPYDDAWLNLRKERKSKLEGEQMTIKTYKNGKVVLKEDGIKIG